MLDCSNGFDLVCWTSTGCVYLFYPHRGGIRLRARRGSLPHTSDAARVGLFHVERTWESTDVPSAAPTGRRTRTDATATLMVRISSYQLGQITGGFSGVVPGQSPIRCEHDGAS